MKYLFKILSLFIIVFLVLKVFIFFFDSGHNISYNVGNFKIKEILKTEDNSYYFEIKHEDFKMNFEINKNYSKSEKIISKVIYKKINGYNCVLPKFKGNEILTDIMCLKNSTIMYGHNLGNKFQKQFQKYGYDKNKYKDKKEVTKLSNTTYIYQNNFLENYYIAMETYKGLNLFGGNQNSVKIFDEDVYKKPISYFTGKYYIVADYTSEYTFKIFHVINIINGKQVDIRSYDDISFDSYIMGAIDDDIYLFDKDANKEYKISIKYESVEEFADKDNLKTYNGKWENISLSDALNGIYFNNYFSADIKGYDKVDKIGNNYYVYEKGNEYYNVYLINKRNKKIKTYLFKTTNLDSIIYLDNSICYLNGNTLYLYNSNGKRKLITNTELEFNNDISFGVYKK